MKGKMGRKSHEILGKVEILTKRNNIRRRLYIVSKSHIKYYI